VSKKVRSPPCRLTSMVSGSAIEYFMGGMMTDSYNNNGRICKRNRCKTGYTVG